MSNAPTQKTDVLSLYVGPVMHARLKPFAHRFQYEVFSILIDLDKLSEAGSLRLFAVNAFAPVSFHEKDHGPCDGSSLRVWANSQLASSGVECPARITLLCYPRIFGYVFNPLSVYFCYDENDALTAVIYEVRNTFGDIHHYVEPVHDEQLSAAGLRQERNKAFYVSPFVDMNMHYAFRVVPPSDKVRLRILESDAQGPLLAATFAGEKREATTQNLIKTSFSIPLLTVKVMAGIHWEALKLWLKGAKFYRNPMKELKKKTLLNGQRNQGKVAIGPGRPSSERR